MQPDASSRLNMEGDAPRLRICAVDGKFIPLRSGELDLGNLLHQNCGCRKHCTPESLYDH